jgi:hypothetical protein
VRKADVKKERERALTKTGAGFRFFFFKSVERIPRRGTLEEEQTGCADEE